MELNEEILKEKFKEYNEMYFSGKLPTPKFTFHRSFRVYGYFTCRHHAPGSRVINPVISISSYYDFNEEYLRDTLVHEMIHFKLERKKQPPKKPHGEEFLAEVARINETYGLNITVHSKYKGIQISKTAPKHSLARWFWG